MFLSAGQGGALGQHRHGSSFMPVASSHEGAIGSPNLCASSDESLLRRLINKCVEGYIRVLLDVSNRHFKVLKANYFSSLIFTERS